MDRTLFFSIIIPAHNEEEYLSQTLESVKALDYPTDSYEVIVVENGSSDKTAEVARGFASTTIRVLSLSERGVAVARNRGIDAAYAKTDWILFLDADTHVQPPCLRDLNAYLLKPRVKSLAIGTASIKPFPPTLVSRYYFLWSDFGHFITRTAYGGFFLVRRDVLDDHRFDEKLSITEDGEVSILARSKGAFFFFNTSTVSTSTRRFDKEGWLWTLLTSAGIAFLPLETRRRFIYKVVR